MTDFINRELLEILHLIGRKRKKLRPRLADWLKDDQKKSKT